MTRLLRIFWLAVLTAHATAALAWWWLMPGGFPFSHPRFWVNRVLPVIVVIVALGARLIRGARGDALRCAVLAFIPAAWIAAAVSARFAFPITFRLLWILPLLIGLTMAAAWVAQFGRHALRGRAVIVAIPFATALGAVLPITQRPGAADTRPLNVAAPPQFQTAHTAARQLKLNDYFAVQPRDALVMCTSGRVSLGIQPLLTFFSRSPDGCHVLLSPRADRIGPSRQLLGLRGEGSQMELSYLDDDVSCLTVDSRAQPTQLRVEAVSSLPKAVWSHLNAFTELTISGQRRLFISFSPCPEQRIEVTPMDYPFGRPARFAYVDAAGSFHVVQASNAEKGPFHQLGRGALSRGDSLVMMLYDEQRAVFRLTFDDFASQAGTSLSPTAGWGAPVNAIEFSLQGDQPSSMASIFVTLASTSVGRGFDSVGHAPGVYRNRIHVEAIEQP